MSWIKRILISLSVLLFATTAHAQILNFHDTLFYNNGIVSIDSSAFIEIYGNTISRGPNSSISNNGAIYVHFDALFSTAHRGFTLADRTQVSGNGYYEIEPHWTNHSPFFNAGESMVHLMSDEQQLITGREPTRFYQLELSGAGVVGNARIKRMTVNATILDSLSLNNREMATDSFVLRINNTEPTAISRSTVVNDIGFISSLKGVTQEGHLLRRTANSTTPYLFPTGSSVNPPASKAYIYRPVDILPENNGITEFSVRFANESPDLEGYDQFKLGDSICTVNPRFYHIINRPTGFDSARVRIYYDPVQDDVYDYISQWGGGQWNLNKNSVYVPNGTLLSVYIPKLKVFSKDSLPFILSDRTPGVPSVIGDNDVCSNGLAMLIAKGNSTFYNWEVTGDMEILSDPTDDTLILRVNGESGYINLAATSSTNKCKEAADSFLLEVNPGPNANFTASTFETFTNQYVNFKDSTLGSPVEWFWNFGDGNNAASPITKHKFDEVGIFVVEMYVMDDNGCIDSSFKVVNIIEGISVPNVFSPNGDGANDVFYVPNSGIGEYHFQIFNRWGTLLFETTASEISWDGYNNNGEPCLEGTYYYLLEARSKKQEYVLKGFVTLFR